MEDKFTVKEFKNYILSKDSLGDVLYNLSAENIHKANNAETLESLREAIIEYFSFDNVRIIENEIVVEESWHGENDSGAIDCAVEHGKMIIEEFPGLEVVEAYCHRHKYSITSLKIKE